MKTYLKNAFVAVAVALSILPLTQCAHDPVTKMNAANASASEISSEAHQALSELYAKEPAARSLGKKAEAVLVFPKIVKGGFVFGAEGGNGALISGGKVTRYYQTAGASYGLQAGVETFGYALFLMGESDVSNLDNVKGWEVGASPDLVVANRGMATSLSTKTMNKGVIAYFFNQKGLMGGLSLKGSKITRIYPGQ